MMENMLETSNASPKALMDYGGIFIFITPPSAYKDD